MRCISGPLDAHSLLDCTHCLCTVLHKVLRFTVMFDQKLNDFLDSDLMFQILHQSAFEKGPIYVLDSSFNPPHYGHLELIKSAPKNCHIILLLSVKNADKKPAPAQFHQRLDMMYLFGEYLLKNWQYSICVSKSPMFVEKSHQINSFFDGEKTYVMGFDTLIRVLHPKYYLPQSIEIALGNFMVSNKFICLTREGEIAQQAQYLTDLKAGNLSSLPSHWAESIELIINEDDSSIISSSDIRQKIINGESVEKLTVKSIIDYIANNNIYEAINTT